MIGIWQRFQRIKWNFELSLFELTVPDLYLYIQSFPVESGVVNIFGQYLVIFSYIQCTTLPFNVVYQEIKTEISLMCEADGVSLITHHKFASVVDCRDKYA